MDPTGFAVGLSGLVGLFTSCLDLVQRYDTYKTASRDKRSLDLQLHAANYRLKYWGNNVGIKEGELSEKHHPALDDPETIRFINDVLGTIKEFMLSSHEPQSSDSIQDASLSGINANQSSSSLKLARLERAIWALRGRSKQNSHVQSLEPLVSMLYDIVPPDIATGLTGNHPPPYTNSLVNANDPVLGFNSEGQSTKQSDEGEIRVMVQKDEEESKAHKLRDLRAWLGSPPPNDIYHDSREKRLGETCEWILHRNKFLEWQDPAATAKVLWIKGPAGFGKTILCAKLVEEVEKTATTPMAYFFLSTKFEGRENPFLAMRSWLMSLVSKSPVAFDIVSKRRLSQHEQTAPQSTIIQLFREITVATPGCIFMLDGLDECTEVADTDTKSVSHFLNELRKAIFNTNSKLLVLSRPAAVIQQGLSLFPGYSVYNIEVDDVGPDLAAFASDVVKRKLSVEDEGWKLSIARKIKNRCEGQFQWVKLQETSLRKGLSKRSLERVIDETPSGLDALYDREWNRINSLRDADKQRALSLLRWAAFAMDPLTVGEIAEAVLITDDCEELPVDEIQEHINDDYIESMILELCGSLIEVREPAMYHSDGDTSYLTPGIAKAGHSKHVRSGVPPKDKQVHLTHFSVKEYISLKLAPLGVLLNNERLRRSVESRQHMALAKCCVQYISFKAVWDEWLEQHNLHHSTHFLYYAATKWHHHYKLVATPDSDLEEDVWALFDESKQIWPNLSRCLSSDLASLDTEQRQPRSRIHVAAAMNLTHVVARLLQQEKVDPNYRTDNGNTPLHHACFHGNKEVATQLLEHGTELDAINESGDTALHLASVFDHGDMVALLIERGANVHARGYIDQTPLHYASSTGRIDVARLLLDKGANPRCKARNGCTPIAAATIGNHINMVQLLLDRGANQGADIDAARYELSEALDAACEDGFLEIAKLLVNGGADVNSHVAGHRNPTPLYSAIQGGHLEMVDFLLDEGCSTEEVYYSLGKPLHYASTTKNSHMVKLLLERGANIEARDNCGRQPIHYASYSGHDEIVILLLENGANIEAREYNGRTPLSYASESGHKSVVQLFLTTYSDNLKATDYCGRNALHYACLGGHDDVVELLIQVEALQDQRDCWGSTPLSMAVRRGHIDAVRTLSRHPMARRNSEDDLGRSLTWWAWRQNHLARLWRYIDPGDGASLGHQVDSSLERPERWDTYCDICCFGVSGKPFYTCNACLESPAAICICSECFSRGGHCFDTGHDLLVHDCK